MPPRAAPASPHARAPGRGHVGAPPPDDDVLRPSSIEAT